MQSYIGKLVQKSLTLSKGLRMRAHMPDLSKFGSGQSNQTMRDPQSKFTENRQGTLDQQTPHFVDAACQGVFKGSHGPIGHAVMDSIKQLVECAAGDDGWGGYAVREKLAHGQLTVATQFALNGDGETHSLRPQSPF